MQAPAAQELLSLSETIASLRRSSLRALPVFAAGVIATIIAAGVALYYIFTLQSNLAAARRELRDTYAALDQARQSLSEANSALKVAQTSAKSSTNAEQKIETAITQVSRSQTALSSASSSLRQAAQKLPDAPPVKGVAVTPKDLERALRFTQGAQTGETSDGTPVYRVTVWLDLPPEAKVSIRDVKYNFFHPDWENPKRGGPASKGYPVSWNGWGCIERANVIATRGDGSWSAVTFNFCDLWKNGRLPSSG